MKKTFLLIFILAALGYSASAQISGGIKGGLNFANIDSETDVDSKTGYHLGAYLNVGAGGISIQPEVLFSVKGAEDFDLSYVEIPILLKKNFAKVVNIHLGPQFGFLTKAEGITGIEVDGSGNVTTTKGDVKDALKGSDISAVFGAGLNLPMGLSLGLRYVLGLSDFNDKIISVDSNGNDFTPEFKNRTFQVYLGYRLFGN